MKKFWALVALIVFFCPVALADSVDYQGSGTLSAGTAFTMGMIAPGSFWEAGDRLVQIDDLTTGVIHTGNLGVLDVKTGTLFACASGLCFNGGSLDIDNLSNHDLFFGKLSSGTITTSGGKTILSAVLANGATTVINLKSGQFSSQALVQSHVIPEPATMGLMGTGLSLLGLIGWKKRAVT
jgi:hypothetical protein